MLDLIGIVLDTLEIKEKKQLMLFAFAQCWSLNKHMGSTLL